MNRLVSRLLRYQKLYWVIFINNLNTVLVYRINGLLAGFAPILWLITVLVFNRLLFTQVNSLGGWTFWQINQLTAVHEILFLISWMFFRTNFDDLVNDVRTGSLDLILTKPVNHWFLVSFKKIDFNSALSLISVFVLFVLSWINNALAFDIGRITGFFLYLALALFLSFFVYFLTSIFTLFLVGSHALSDLVGPLAEFDRYPAEIYSTGLRRILTFGLPILYFAYMPTAYLFDKITLVFLPIGLILLVIFFFLSKIAWIYSLKRYSSASS